MALLPLKKKLANTLLFGSLAFTAGAVFAQAPNTEIRPLVDQMYPQLESIYHDLHANPELPFQEVRTAAKLAEAMRELGFEVTEQVGKTGVVALFKNGEGPTVMVRADMDALPMEEKTGLPYASKATGLWQDKETAVMHSCGHDLHMTAWIGTARALVELKDQWQGTLMFIGQPAEEVLGGAQAMVDDGLFTRFPKPDFAFGLHTDPMEAGLIGYRSGPITSASSAIDITFNGRGGHGSAPHHTIDPVLMAANFVSNVQNVVSRKVNPNQFGVITIGAINGGSVGNIIPDSVNVKGTIRSYAPEVSQELAEGVRRTALASAALADAPEPEIHLVTGATAIINDDDLVERTVTALRSQFGEDKVKEVAPVTASEDFSVYGLSGIPSMFFLIGVTDPKLIKESLKPDGKPVPFNHSPYFAPLPEPSIKTSVEAMTTAVLTTLKQK